MAAPSLPLDEDFINKCFSGLPESYEQNIIGINKFKKEIEKLKVEPEGRVATDKVNQWLSDLESLEGQAASILEKFKRICELGHGEAPEPTAHDFRQIFCRIIQAKVYTGGVVNGLEIIYEGGLTCIAGNCAGKLGEFELERGEYINSMIGFIKDYNGEICIVGLGFKTNFGNEYGPFGHACGEKFTVPAKAGRIIGFFGQYDCHINSIGVWEMNL